MKNIILTNEEIIHKTKRISYQILETFVDEKEVVIAGIANSGYTFAQKISEELSKISDLNVVLCEVKINKQNPQSPALFLSLLNSERGLRGDGRVCVRSPGCRAC